MADDYLIYETLYRIKKWHCALNLFLAHSKVLFIYKTPFWNHALETRFLFSRSVFFYKPPSWNHT